MPLHGAGERVRLPRAAAPAGSNTIPGPPGPPFIADSPARTINYSWTPAAELEDGYEAGAEVRRTWPRCSTASAMPCPAVDRASHTNRAGFLVINRAAHRAWPWNWTAWSGVVPLEGPVKAFQVDEGKGKVVVELPPLGFAWVAKARTPGSPPAWQDQDGRTRRACATSSSRRGRSA